MLQLDRENVVISLTPSSREWCFSTFDEEDFGFDNAVTLTRDGGDPIMLFKNLSYKTTNLKDNDKAIYELISNPQNFEEYIITFGTKENDFIPKNSPLIKDHSYRLYPTRIDSKTGTIIEFKLIDPTSIVETTMSIDELRKHGGIYSIARRDKTNTSEIQL